MADWSGDLARKIKELEEENERLSTKLSKSAKHLLRLRLEKKLLLEKLEEVNQTSQVSSTNVDNEASGSPSSVK